MLVLSRRLQEKVLLPTIQTTIQVLAIKPGVVRLGIDAPGDVLILREEIQDRAAEWGEPAARPASQKLRQLQRMIDNRLTIGRAGLEVVRQQLQAGLVAEAQNVVAKIDDELQMLQERLGLEVGQAPDLTPSKIQKACKALLVEDNANERELLATLLRASGVEVATAGDGADALDYLQRGGRADVLLVDMGMPRCDGPTMVRTLRRDPAYAGLKIFAVTGHTADEFDLVPGPQGIDRWFMKPVNPNQLIHDVTEEFGSHRNGR
jgi:carbon storage regulator CsrA